MNKKCIQGKILVCIIIVTIAIVPLLLLPIGGDNTPELVNSAKYKVSQYFVDENGKEIDSIPMGEKDYYLQHTIPQGVDLCFQSKSVNFSVYYGDQEIYRYYPTVPKIYGRGYGKMYHYVALPDHPDMQQIRIHTVSATKDGKSYIKDIYFADASDYIAEQILDNIPNFLLCFFIFIVGLFLVCGGLALKPDKDEYAYMDQKHRLEILSMGVFAICAAAWSGTETDIMQIITQNPSGVHLISYFSLMMLPAPTVLFISAMTDSLDSFSVKVVTYGTLINFIAVVTSVALGGPDYHDLLITTHILLGFAIATDAVVIIRSVIHKTIPRKTVLVIVCAFLIVLLSGILEIARYRFVSNSTDTSTLFRLGMCAFVIILSVYEIRELMNYTRYKEEAYVMRKLAHEDGLTGLKNRLAYNERLAFLEKEEEGRGLIIYLDINDLKSVNDFYGHDEGDRHIKAAADVILKTFGTTGECYRIGGDEFAVVSAVPDPTLAKAEINKMRELSIAYNYAEDPPVRLVIAAGVSAYNCAKHNIREAQRLADDAMYAEKAELKGNAK